jgi:hypothetical protein
MNNNQKAFIAMGLMVALAFVVVGASSLVTPVEAARAVGAGSGAGQSASSCAKASPGSDCSPTIVPAPGP